jgi:signal transduction histidine kinase
VAEKFDREATVVVEVIDDGDPEPAFGPEAGRAGGARAGDGLLGSIRERARQFGGELLVQSDATGTAVRLLMATPDAEVARAACSELMTSSLRDDPSESRR